MQGSTAIKVAAAAVVGVLVGDVTTATAAPDGSIYAIHGSACIGTKEVDRPRARYSGIGVFNAHTGGGALTVTCPGGYVSNAAVHVSGRTQPGPIAGQILIPSCKLSVVDQFGRTLLWSAKMTTSLGTPSGYWEATGVTGVASGVFSVECGLPAVPASGAAASVTLIRAF